MLLVLSCKNKIIIECMVHLFYSYLYKLFIKWPHNLIQFVLKAVETLHIDFSRDSLGFFSSFDFSLWINKICKCTFKLQNKGLGKITTDYCSYMQCLYSASKIMKERGICTAESY